MIASYPQCWHHATKDMRYAGFAGALVSSLLVLAGCTKAPGEPLSSIASVVGATSVARCPNPLPLSARPLERASAQARLEAPVLYGAVEAEGVKVTRSYRATAPGTRSGQVRRECGEQVARRTVVVELLFPRMLPSASLSQGVVFVSRFRAGYRVWRVAR